MSADTARQTFTEDTRRKALLQVALTDALNQLNAGALQAALATLHDARDLAWDSDAAAYVFGLFHFNAGATQDSLLWFDRALAHNNDYPDALAARAVALQRLGRADEALADFDTILRLQPDDARAHLSRGILLQGAGRTREALAAYGAALAADPTCCEALINRGALLEQAGQYAEALASFEAARIERPEDAMILFNCGSVLQQLGRDEEALAAYDESYRLNKTNPELHLNRGNVLQKLGRFEDALFCYEEALHQRQDYAQAYYNRAIALQRLGCPQDALVAYDAALSARPIYPEALCNRGNVLHELGCNEAALAAYAQALQQKPGFRPALLNRASVLVLNGRTEEALVDCDQILDTTPDHAQALCVKGAALQSLGRFAQALTALDAALRAKPAYPEALLNRGNVLQDLGRGSEALACYTAVLALRPDYAEAHSCRGVALKEQGRIAEALAAFDAALALKPDFADARNNRAGALLLDGDLAAGFEDFESRWHRTRAPGEVLRTAAPLWEGQSLEGKSIVVWDEQGLGDLIQFSRYLPLLVARGASVTVLARPSMHRLLASLPSAEAIRFVATPPSGGIFDFQAPLMSLPRAFKTDLGNLPAPHSYLRPEKERVTAWAERLGGHGFRIGICTRGNAKINLSRTVPPAFLAPLARLPGVRLISLMREPPEMDPELAETLAVESFADLDAGPDAFLDTAAIIANCDLVVTSDTSLPHLAAALGKPVFLALKAVPDWRWMMKRPDSPWYPTMRLFRQREAGQWAPVFAEITEQVKALVEAKTRGTPAAEIAIPAALGELIDKITILTIKAARITAPEKLLNVRRELEALCALKAKAGLTGGALATLERQLAGVNEALWTIEDDLRALEARQEFGARFVELARQVYKTNDRRAALKRQINLLFNSSIVEEKSYAAY